MCMRVCICGTKLVHLVQNFILRTPRVWNKIKESLRGKKHKYVNNMIKRQFTLITLVATTSFKTYYFFFTSKPLS